MPDNLPQQIATLTDAYRFLVEEGDIDRDNLKAKLLAALGVMEDGSEINALSFEGGSTSAIVMYPKEVVIAACRQVIREIDAEEAGDPVAADSSVVHADLSRTRIES